MSLRRELRMQYAGGLVKHLGLQMYSGAVRAIAELIANAWDADARNVWIDIPLDTPIDESLEIRVHDDGIGMSFDDVNKRYLVVGRGRREAEGTSHTPRGRKLMGRKGIGKLAGFGIAQIIEIWTVKDKWLTAFRMDYEKITHSGTAALVEEYKPEVLEDRNVKKGDPLQAGTVVVLERLQLKRQINGERFREGLTRRFAVLSSQFRVHVNGEELKREELEFEFHFPEGGGKAAEEIEGLGQIKWSVGFMPTPIKSDEARGIAVLARGKLAQAPFFFHLSGGVQGQHGMQYLTGEVEADFLDEEVDLIATDRAMVRWEDPRAQPLLEWGQRKIRELLREWSERRLEKKIKKLRDTTPYLKRIERFPERERLELTKAINRLASIETIEDDRLAELVDFLVKAYENEHFMRLIRSLNAADEKAQDEIFRLVAEWDVLEAIATAQIVRGRVEVIRKFQRLIETKAPEKPDLQDFLKKHPWLMDPGWQVLQHERSLDKVIAEQFGLAAVADDGGGQRLDFFCMADSLRAVVVEVKRPGLTVGRDELQKLEDYVDYLRTWARGSTEAGRARRIEGCLIYSTLSEDAWEKVERLRQNGFYIRTWSGMLETAESLHREFLDIVKTRAPADDPRIQNLEALDSPKVEQSGTSGEDENG